MNWQNVSFDWNQARAFLATLEEGSLSAAARALGVTQPTLGRQVSALEKSLGVILFERIGKTLVPTPESFSLAEHVRTMYEAANKISLSASGKSQSIAGKVIITASDAMSAYIIPEAVRTLRFVAPLVEINVVASNNIQDLQMREADIAIRHVRPEQPELIARLICENSGYFYASESYISKRGLPVSTDDLTDHDFVGYGGNSEMVRRLNEFGLSLDESNFKSGSASGVVAWELARSGLGIIIMSEKIADGFADMHRLDIKMDPLTFPIWLVAHRELYTSARIRLVFDHLADFLQNRLG